MCHPEACLWSAIRADFMHAAFANACILQPYLASSQPNRHAPFVLTSSSNNLCVRRWMGNEKEGEAWELGVVSVFMTEAKLGTRNSS